MKGDFERDANAEDVDVTYPKLVQSIGKCQFNAILRNIDPVDSRRIIYITQEVLCLRVITESCHRTDIYHLSIDQLIRIVTPS